MVPLLQEDSEATQGGIFGDSMFAKDFAGKIEQKNEEEDAYRKEMAIFDQYYNQAYENLYKLIAIRFDVLSLSINCVSEDCVPYKRLCPPLQTTMGQISGADGPSKRLTHTSISS